MNTKAFIELFPLFSTANPETVEWLLSVAVRQQYPRERTILVEDSWGNAVYLIVSGWVKVRKLLGENSTTLAILSRGDFFGEMAILEEAPRSTDVVSLSDVKLFSISAQRFIQALFKDVQLHHRLLQLMVKRLRYFNSRCQLRQRPPAVKLAKAMLFLAESYGIKSERGIEILRVPDQDLADISEITVVEAKKILEKLEKNKWIEVNQEPETLILTHFKQLIHLAGKD